MKAIILATVGLAAGCGASKGDPGERGAQGPQGLPGDTGPAGMQGAQGDPGPVGPAGPKGADGMGAPTKTPHLIGPAGVDLGPMVGPTSTWYAAASGEVDWSPLSATGIWYEQPNCQGNPYTHVGGGMRWQSARLLGPNGSIWKATGPAAMRAFVSVLDTDKACKPAMDMIPAYPVADLKIPAQPYPPDSLAVDLR